MSQSTCPIIPAMKNPTASFDHGHHGRVRPNLKIITENSGHAFIDVTEPLPPTYPSGVYVHTSLHQGDGESLSTRRCSDPLNYPPLPELSNSTDPAHLNVNTSPRTVIALKIERAKLRFACSFFAFFTLGWADGVTGTLLPYFKADFHLSFMTSSLFFVASATGYALGTILVERVTRLLGRSYFSSSSRPCFFASPSIVFKRRSSPRTRRCETILGFSPSQARYLTLFLASILHACFFAIMGSRRGFASMLVAYVISAFARSFITAALNIYVSAAPRKGLGYIYGSWAIGAFASPLVCQSIIAVGVTWSHFYLGSLVVSALNTTFISFAFRPTQDEVDQEVSGAWAQIRSRQGSIDAPKSTDISTATDSKIEDNSTLFSSVFETTAPVNTLRRAITTPYVWAFSIFSFLYSGTESATQGYIVLYLLNVRNADPNTVGYVTSGFWGGMAISRLLWGFASPRLCLKRRKYLIHFCILFAMCMHITIWTVNSCIENATAAALIGTLYGPIFPGNLGIANDILPKELHMVTMAIMSAFASFGAALFPFITGTLSNIEGAHILPYVTVAQTATMFCLWFFFPSKLPQ